jgi:hypothetical protein
MNCVNTHEQIDIQLNGKGDFGAIFVDADNVSDLKRKSPAFKGNRGQSVKINTVKVDDIYCPTFVPMSITFRSLSSLSSSITLFIRWTSNAPFDLISRETKSRSGLWVNMTILPAFEVKFVSWKSSSCKNVLKYSWTNWYSTQRKRRLRRHFCRCGQCKWFKA